MPLHCSGGPRPRLYTHKHVANYVTFQFSFVSLSFNLRTILTADKGRGISGAWKSICHSSLHYKKKTYRGRERLFFKPTTRMLCRLLPHGGWEDNIKMDPRDTEQGWAGWTDLTLHTDTWRAPVNTNINLRVT